MAFSATPQTALSVGVAMLALTMPFYAMAQA